MTTREDANAFKAAHTVETTPIAFIDGNQIGGYSDLKKHFGYRVLGQHGTTYQSVLAPFVSVALMALANVVNF